MSAGVTAPGRYMTFESPVGTDYQVPAGKTFYITKIICSDVSASSGFYLGYGDTGVAEGAAAPVNYQRLTGVTHVNTAYYSYPFDVCIPIPANKFPVMAGSAAASQVTLYGVEI